MGNIINKQTNERNNFTKKMEDSINSDSYNIPLTVVNDKHTYTNHFNRYTGCFISLDIMDNI